MVILDGKKLADKILTNLRVRGKKIKLAVILVGGDPVSQIFINQKRKACKKVGVGFELFKFSAEVRPPLLKEEIKKIVDNSANSGVIIQLPLPQKFNTEEFLNLIPPKKDVDVLSEESFKKFAEEESAFLPPVVGAILILFKNYRIKIKNKNIVIVGGGRLVGKPLAAWLKIQKVKFSALDKNSKNIFSHTKEADI
ncbi:MAG: bifunctional 5,10-methylenetetrahydrofolate dehydrogenase/5,10-methenyltetrahydrofolate cyclohydrolase, partial [Candidatus Wildermuthbacteria bacterium]|nr:bifunctional 5,10-methylenetetrahydrofolate dehydrogenase/5,10-methenyltetrahydrofolate cyclohydrolase [Candidatus Wildermuthbacteria bacterium]